MFKKACFSSLNVYVILDLISKEPCVIVGTCADYIIRDSVDYLSVFVHASDEKERSVSLRFMEKERKPQRKDCTIRMPKEKPIISFIQELNGGMLIIMNYVKTVARLELMAVSK